MPQLRAGPAVPLRRARHRAHRVGGAARRARQLHHRRRDRRRHRDRLPAGSAAAPPVAGRGSRSTFAAVGVLRGTPRSARLGLPRRDGRRIHVVAGPMLTRSPHVLYTNVVEALLRFVLVSRGYMLLHSACLDIDGRGVMLSALTDTGKTGTVLRLLREGGGRFLSDDMTILDAQRHGAVVPEAAHDQPPHPARGPGRRSHACGMAPAARAEPRPLEGRPRCRRPHGRDEPPDHVASTR